MHSKHKEAEDQSILEKKQERERVKAELSDDLKFNTTMGMLNNVLLDY